MNNIFKSALLLMAGALMFTSCSDDRDSNPTLQIPETFVLNSPAYAGQAIDLQNSETVNLTWSQPDYGGFPVATEYNIEVSATNEWTVSNLEETADDTGATQCNYYILDGIYSTCNAEIDAATLAKALVVMCNYVEGEVPEKQEIYARVKANTPGAPEITSNVVNLLVKPYYIELKPAAPVLWYMVGNCIGSNDWDNGKNSVGTGLIPLLPMPGADVDAAGNTTLVYAGYFPEGGQFKFVKIPGSWDDQMNYTNIDTNDAGVTDEDGDNHNIGIPEAGYYRIEMNTVQGKFSIEKLNGPYTEFSTMGIPGEHNDWNTSGDLLTAMGKRDNTQSHDWMGEITLSGGKFKFAANGSWDVNWGGTDFPIGYGTQGGADIVSKVGNYTVYFNDILGLYYFMEKE